MTRIHFDLIVEKVEIVEYVRNIRKGNASNYRNNFTHFQDIQRHWMEHIMDLCLVSHSYTLY